jgi:soluble lytic murein transglycosylase-like protein
MKRDTLWLLLGLGALLLLGGGAAVVLMDWKRNGAAYLPLLNAAEDKYGIPRDLLARQAYEESRFREDIISGAIVSPAGAVGIMQIVPHWHPGVDPLNVGAAIDYAGGFLRSLYDQFGSWSLALAAYNWGPGNVAKHTVDQWPEETQKYVSEITGDVPAALA